MLKFALLIWLALISYKIYDFQLSKNNKEISNTKISQGNILKQNQQSAFNKTWQGYKINKTKIKKNNAQMRKAIPVSQNSRND